MIYILTLITLTSTPTLLLVVIPNTRILKWFEVVGRWLCSRLVSTHVQSLGINLKLYILFPLKIIFEPAFYPFTKQFSGFLWPYFAMTQGPLVLCCPWRRYAQLTAKIHFMLKNKMYYFIDINVLSLFSWREKKNRGSNVD